MRKGRHLATGIVLCLAVSFAGCEDEGAPLPTGNETPPAPTVSFATDVQPLFDANCVGCHGAVANGGLDLRDGSSHGNLVGTASPTYGQARVVPFDPDASVLYDKLSGGGMYGERMPFGLPPLAPANVELVRTWIAEGALDN